MAFDAKLGSQTFDYKQIIDSTHPAVIMPMKVKANQGELKKGQIVVKDSNGDVVPYAKYEYVSESVDNRQTIGTGDGSAKTFSGTLNDKPVCPGSIIVTAGSVTGVDDGCGNIKGTGLDAGYINYKTGAISVTFTTAPSNGTAIKVAYANRPVGVLTNVIDTTKETTGSVIVHGTVVKSNLLVKAGTSVEAATTTDVGRLEPNIIAI